MKAAQKRERLLELARKRQSDRLPPHHCLADFHAGYYECDHVSPWSISACNVDAELMLIGQDWASSETLEREPDEKRRTIGQDWFARTNSNLREFLGYMRLEFSEIYATNLFPFIKQGSKNASIPLRDLVQCGRTYAFLKSRSSLLVRPSALDVQHLRLCEERPAYRL